VTPRPQPHPRRIRPTRRPRGHSRLPALEARHGQVSPAQSAGGSRQWAVGSGQKAVGSGQKADGSGQKAVGSDEAERRVCPHCGRDDAWVAHYAAFPSDLPRRCILAATSAAGACPECGKPWERAVEKGAEDREHQVACGSDADGEYHGAGKPEPAIGQRPGDVKANVLRGLRKSATLGWQPACDCADAPDAPLPLPEARKRTVPCRVLDCFSGTGTTALVAAQLGRDWTGIEASPSYAALSRERIRLLGTRKSKAAPLSALPLFAKGDTR